MMCDHTRPVFGCDGCIARANVGVPIGDPAAHVYRVELERRHALTFYIVAASSEQARIEADEIAGTFHGSDFDEVDDDLTVFEIDAIPDGEEAWVGGPKGGWVTPPRLVSA